MYLFERPEISETLSVKFVVRRIFAIEYIVIPNISYIFGFSFLIKVIFENMLIEY